MVIHDMRNPTTSIEFAVKEVLNLLSKVFDPRQIMIRGQSFVSKNYTSPPIFIDNPPEQNNLPFSKKDLRFTREVGSNKAGGFGFGLGFSNSAHSQSAKSGPMNQIQRV
jgi:hypothetical protein